jgi:hypothetical protein
VESAQSAGDESSANGLASLASLGVPESSASSMSQAKAPGSRDEAEAIAEESSVAALAWESTGGYSMLDEADGFELLVASTDGSDGSAEDAVFAGWGMGRAF